MDPIKIFIMVFIKRVLLWALYKTPIKGFYYGYIKNVKKKCYLYFS